MNTATRFIASSDNKTSEKTVCSSEGSHFHRAKVITKNCTLEQQSFINIFIFL